MESVILEYPVVSVYGDKLVDSGVELTIDNIHQIIPVNKTIFDRNHFLKIRSVKDDIITNLSSNPYHSLLWNEDFDDFIGLMEKVVLPDPVIESILYFRENDYSTYTHFLMVFVLTSLLSKNIISDEAELLKSISAGSTHDIGKIAIPKSILQKSSPLKKKEKEYLKQHTLYGYILLTYYFNGREPHIADIARDHHERIDGSGYPFKRKTDQTDTNDIVIICDIFDALISSRPYRPEPYSIRSAIEEITELAVLNKVNWKVIKALVNILRKNETDYTTCEVSLEKRCSGPDFNYYGVYAESE